MPIFDILTSQLTDLFRIGLIIALIITARRNAAVTGWWLPLAFGVVFVAVMIPSMLSGQSAAPFWHLVIVGLGANVILLAAAMGIWAVAQRGRK